MSKALARLLEHPEAAVAKALAALEEKNGWPSHDVRLSADNIPKIRAKLADLRLDPNDTTADELYHALKARFAADARRFDEHFGMFGQTFDQKIDLAIKLVAKQADLPDRWVLKPTAAKQLLHQHPPKQLMKRLHYRSIDSFIKRENIAEIYLAVEFVESSTWNKAHFKLASSLATTAFEMRKLKLLPLTNRFGLSGQDELYVASGDYGVLGIRPSQSLAGASLLSLVVLLLDEIGAKPSKAADLSPTAAWWSETDHLIADLNGQTVSLNLKDIALNHAANAELRDCQKSAAQYHFWRELLSRYEKALPPDEDLLSILEAPLLSLKTPTYQPAFEYAEGSLDG